MSHEPSNITSGESLHEGAYLLVSAEPARTPLDATTNNATHGGALVLLLSLVTALIGASWSFRALVRRRVAGLLDVVSDCQGSDRPPRATVAGRDKLGLDTLAMGLNSMADILRLREEALAQSEERYRMAVETAAVPIMIHVEDGEILAVSDGLLAATGYGRDELVDFDAWTRLAYRTEASEVRGRVASRFAQGLGMEAVQRRVHARDGRVMTWEWFAAAPQRLADGRLHFVTVATDLTARLESEASLEAQEKLARRIADISPTVLYVYDLPTRRVVYINNSVLPALGYANDAIKEFGSRVVARLLHREDLPEIIRCVNAVTGASGDTTVELQFRIRRAEGAWRWFQGRVTVFTRNDAGEATQIIGSALDITAGKMMDVALRERDEMLGRAEGAAQLGIWDVDLRSNSVRGTPQYFRLHGLEPTTDAVAHDAVRAFRHPDDLARVVAEFQRAVEAGEDTFETEYRVRRGDGEWRWILGRGQVVRAADGIPVRYTGVDLDITERKRSDEIQRLLLLELDHRAKNLLTVVRAMTVQSASHADNVPALRDALLGRLHAMAVAHEILAASNWRGAALSVIADRTLAPHRGSEARRLILDVSDVTLDPGSAQIVSLALHELATNAFKHGAWSSPHGTVHLTGHLQGDRLTLLWSERGGPAVAPPITKGFGSTLLTRAFAHQTGGSVAMAWPSTGLVCTLSMPAPPCPSVPDRASLLGDP